MTEDNAKRIRASDFCIMQYGIYCLAVKQDRENHNYVLQLPISWI